MTGGHNPGSSLRCDECKKSRRKCDLQQPECLRCLQSGIKCSGPKPNTALFVNRYADAFRSQTQREALIAAFGDRKATTSTTHPYESYQATFDHVQHVRAMVEKLYATSSLTMNDNLISANRALILPTYTALLEEFKPGREVGIFSGDRISNAVPGNYSSMATCIRSLLPLASLRIATLDRCIISLLALYYGRLHGDAGLVEFARSSYTTALNLFSRQLKHSFAGSNPSEWLSMLMFMSMALQLFEHLNQVDVFGEGHLAHINGALELLHSAGPEMLQKSPEVRHAFCGLRGVAVFVAIEQREPTFLASLEWSSALFQDVATSPRDRLKDLAVEIPALLHSTDDVLARLDKNSTGTASLIDLGLHGLNEIAALQRRFDEWLYSLKISAEGPLFWPYSQPLVLVENNRDAECSPRYRDNFHQLVFRSAPVAGLLVQFWSFKLQLLMTSIDLQQSLQHFSSHIADIDSDMRLVSQTLSHGLSTDGATAEETAHFILEAQPYLSSCLEGLLCLQAPLRIVVRYFEKLKGGGTQ